MLGESDEAGGVLRVTRTSSRDIKVRELYVRVDGGKERTLKFGDSFEMKLEAGAHEISITNRLFKKRIQFEIEPEVNFEVANVIGGCLTVVFILGIYSVAIERVEL